MYGCNHLGAFPPPHSPNLSVPEMIQELYAKINECVNAVNECIEMVDTSNNVVENWLNVKAQIDLTMEQYATVMAQYEQIMSGYTQELSDLENRVDSVTIDVNTFENLIGGLKDEATQTAQNAIDSITDIANQVTDDIAVMADSIVEVGTTEGWNWRKYKSGRCEMETVYQFNKDDVHTVTYGYTINAQIKLPFTINTNAMVWVQPKRTKTFGVYNYTTGTHISVDIQSDIEFVSNVNVICKLEGTVSA